jgi:hypothetical protein
MGLDVEPSPLLLRSSLGLLFQPCMTDGDDCGAVSVMHQWQGKPKYSEETCPSAAMSTVDPTNDVSWTRTRASQAGSRRLTA